MLRSVRALGAVPRLARMSSAAVGTRIDHAKQALRDADAVCFDVDSTVINVEGIDELAAYLGCGEAVAKLTASAMGGSKPFHEPMEQVLTPGVAELIAGLQQRNKKVYMVSGGFRQ